MSVEKISNVFYNIKNGRDKLLLAPLKAHFHGYTFSAMIISNDKSSAFMLIAITIFYHLPPFQTFLDSCIKKACDILGLAHNVIVHYVAVITHVRGNYY